MCHLSAFLFHLDNYTSFFFLLIPFGKFQQENYIDMWGHYGLKVMGFYSGPLSEAPSLTIDLLWLYKPFIYGKFMSHLLF
jgi:hypothetical protein